MMDRIHNAIERIDALTLRERAVILAALLTVMFLGWYSYFIEPLSSEEKTLISDLDTKRRQLQAMNEQFEILTSRQAQDPNELMRDRLARLRSEQSRLQEELRTATANLVDPERMPEVLQQVLQSADGLHLVKMQGLGSTPLLQPPKSGDKKSGQKDSSEPAADQGDTAAAYKHGLEIQFTGDYFSTLDYLRQLEGLSVGFYWESVDYRVNDYPAATASIRLFTLSINPNWIGT